ncbi:MFS transporter [Bradyrhizobium sp. 2TAF24]|uniref:MFS transporter n=1 Tax=Bradyrhizobium sp. 2TAF24 TaxID=3233011 RepID=UPI003F914D8B
MNKSLAPTALMLGNFVTGVAVLSPTGMLDDLSRALGVSVYQAGLLITFGAVLLCIGSPLMIWATSRVGRRVLLAGSMAGVAVCHVAALIAPDYAALLTLRLVMLAFLVVFTPVAAGTVSMIVPEASRASSITYVFLGWSLALVAGIPLVTYMTAHFGWREALLGIGIMAAIAALLIALCLPRGLVGAPVELRTWAALGRNRLVLLLLLITTLHLAGQFCTFPYLGPLLARLTQASSTTIGFTFLIFGACGFVGNLVAMRLVGRVGPFRTSLIFLGAMLSGSLVWVIGVDAAALPLLLTASVLWGLGFAAINSMQQTRLIGAAPAFASAAVALNTSMVYVGQAVGSAIGGKFFEQQLFHANGYASAAFVLLAITVAFFTRPAPAVA